MRKWQLRRAITSDVDALTRCIDAAYAVYRDRIQDLPPVSEGVADDIRNNIVWVAETDNRVIGGLVLVVDASVLMVANVAVDPAYAGRGVGRAMMEKADQEARALGKSEMRLNTHIDMPDNIALYRHLGWSELARISNSVQMNKVL